MTLLWTACCAKCDAPGSGRYEEGVAVETGMIVWSFDLNPANAEAIALQP